MTLTKEDLPIGANVRFIAPAGRMRRPIPTGTVGKVVRHEVTSGHQFFYAEYEWRETENGCTVTQDYRHRIDKEGVSWEQMPMPKVGDIVEAIRGLDPGPGLSESWIPAEARGTVTRVYDPTSSCTVVYDWLDARGKPRTCPYTHALSFHGDTWRIVGHSAKAPTTHTMTIESEKEINLFIAQSTETIDGWVPQVKYGDVIVWQGDPVSETDKDGEALSSNHQSSNAIQAAGDKIKEVVKKQFA